MSKDTGLIKLLIEDDKQHGYDHAEREQFYELAVPELIALWARVKLLEDVVEKIEQWSHDTRNNVIINEVRAIVRACLDAHDSEQGGDDDE